MTTGRIPQRDLPQILDELVVSPFPDYIDNVLTSTAHTRQRPAWTFPERWVPMTAVTSRAAPTPRITLRIAALAALLLLVVALGAVFIAGSRTPRLPAPFGPAVNGHVAYASGGDIYTADPVTGVATAVITGPDIDSAPVFSRDGTHIAFLRQSASDSPTARLYVATADGTNLIALTPDPVLNIQSHSFSPDGRSVVFASGVRQGGDQPNTLWLANTDGSGIRQLKVGAQAREPSFLPPDGTEVVYAGESQVSAGSYGLYAVNLANGKVRPIVVPAPDYAIEAISASPDGSRIAYALTSLGTEGDTFLVHVVTQDGKTDLTLPMPPGAVNGYAGSWSNDSTRLVVTRGYALDDSDMVLAVVPADGSSPGRETAHGLTGFATWAPDDQSILVAPQSVNGSSTQQLLLDPAQMNTKPAPWAATSEPSWQRAAP